MANETVKCPVCGETLEEGLCPKCDGREAVITQLENYIEALRESTPVRSVDDILKEIDELVGLNGVKNELRSLLKAAMNQRKIALENASAASEKMNLNFIFTGSPGTGKSTVANLIAKILYRSGLIDGSDKPVVVNIVDILKMGVGDTPKAIQQLFSDNVGKVIMIDEANGLTKHGPEIIDEITNCLTDERYMGNQALILAGYTQEMNDMLSANRGLYSRFGNHWIFEDFTNEELWTIFRSLATGKGLSIADEEICRELASEYFDQKRRTLSEQFSNARNAHLLFSNVSKNYMIREVDEGVTDLTLRPKDFPNYDGRSNEPEPRESSEV